MPIRVSELEAQVSTQNALSRRTMKGVVNDLKADRGAGSDITYKNEQRLKAHKPFRIANSPMK